jgi:hypothetical protein
MWLSIADVSKHRVSFIFKGQLIFKGDGTTIFRNVWNHKQNRHISEDRTPNTYSYLLPIVDCALV